MMVWVGILSFGFSFGGQFVFFIQKVLLSLGASSAGHAPQEQDEEQGLLISIEK